MVHLEDLFTKLHKINTKIHPKKCEFVVTSIVYLGHKILPNGIMAHWAKIVTILEMPNPIDVHTLKSFIRYVITTRFMFNIQSYCSSFLCIIEEGCCLTWSEEIQEALNTLKEKISEFPILRRLDFNKVFILHTDWSALGIGAIFGQLDEEGKEYVITYAS